MQLKDRLHKITRAHIGIAVLVVVIFLLYGRPYITSDGGSYFAITDSIVNDYDLNLENQKYLTDVVSYAVQFNPNVGRFVSIYSAGNSFLMAPFVWVFSQIDRVTHLFPGYETYFHVPFLEAFGVLVASSFYTLITLFLMQAIVRRYFGKTHWGVGLAVFFSLPVFFYAVVEPSFAHATDTFVVTAFLWAFAYREKLVWKQYHVAYIMLGFLAGLMVIVRNVDVVFILPVVLHALYERYRGRTTTRVLTLQAAQFAAGILPFFLFSLWYNNYFYGGPFRSGYAGIGVLDSYPAYLFHYYLSPIRGIFFWAPVTILSLVGLWDLRKKKEAFFITVSSLICASLILGIYNRWWAGLSFGQRYMTMLYPFFVLGLTAFLEAHHKKIWKGVVIGASAFSIFLLHIFLINLNSRIGNNALLANDSLYTPFELIHAAGEVYGTEATPAQKNPLVFLYDRVYGGTNPTLIYAAQKQLAGLGPALLLSSEATMDGEDAFKMTMQVHSFGKRQPLTIGVDVWELRETDVHPDSHLFWANAAPITVDQGDHTFLVSCTLRGSCTFTADGEARATGDTWANPNIDSFLRTSRVLRVRAVQYSPDGTVDADPNKIYYRKNSIARGSITLCDAYPNRIGDRCVWNSQRWKANGSAFQAIREKEYPSDLVVALPGSEVDPDGDGVTNMPITFRARVKIDHNSSGRGLYFVRWNKKGDTTDMFPPGVSSASVPDTQRSDRRVELYETEDKYQWTEVTLPAGDTIVTHAGNSAAVMLGISTYNDGDTVYVDDFDAWLPSE